MKTWMKINYGKDENPIVWLQETDWFEVRNFAAIPGWLTYWIKEGDGEQHVMIPSTSVRRVRVAISPQRPEEPAEVDPTRPPISE